MIDEKEWRAALSRCARPFVANERESRHWWRPETLAAFVERKVATITAELAAYEDSARAASDGEVLAAALRAVLARGDDR
jgi:hypothetical protein